MSGRRAAECDLIAPAHFGGIECSVGVIKQGFTVFKNRRVAACPDTANGHTNADRDMNGLFMPGNIKCGLADFIDWGKALRAECSNCRISTSDEKKNVNNKWALGYIATFGAYAYFDEHHCLVGVNAITLKETPYELVFEGPFIAKSKAYKEIQDLNRYQSLYLGRCFLL